MPREFFRHQRLAPQLLRTLNELVAFESKDPRLSGVSLSDVELSRDLSVARLYFSLLDPNGDPEAAAAGLERAKGFLRSRLADALSIRRVPELRFEYDAGTRQAVEMSQLIDKVNARNNDADPDDGQSGTGGDSGDSH